MFQTGIGEVINLDDGDKVLVKKRETEPARGNICVAKSGRPAVNTSAFMGSLRNGGMFLGFEDTNHVLRKADQKTLCLFNSSEQGAFNEDFQCDDEYEINEYGRGKLSRRGIPLQLTRTGLCLLDSIGEEIFSVFRFP
mmetsp:Transcript_53611/g.160485  ORF Transcript_53611/g.160485 Transcript_53611/m.160485 type:complete len:138 (-) Transcript_53611:159-572(-)